MTHAHVPPGVVAAAGRAMSLALAGQIQAAADTVSAMANTYGEEWIVTAMMAWADTLAYEVAHHFGLPVEVLSARLDGLLLQDTGTGRVDTNADEVPPAPRWAARLIHARIRMDEDMWTALLAALPHGNPAEVGRHVIAVLTTAADTLAGLRAGRPVLFATTPGGTPR